MHLDYNKNPSTPSLFQDKFINWRCGGNLSNSVYKGRHASAAFICKLNGVSFCVKEKKVMYLYLCTDSDYIECYKLSAKSRLIFYHV